MPTKTETDLPRVSSRLAGRGALVGGLGVLAVAGSTVLLAGCQRDPVSTVTNSKVETADKTDADKTSADKISADKTADKTIVAPTDSVVEAPEARPKPTTEPRYHVLAKAKAGVTEGSEGYPRFRVYGIDDGEVLIAHGPWLMRPESDGTLARDPAWVRGIVPPEYDPGAVLLAVDWTVHSVGGRWPDGLYMTISYLTPFRAEVYYNQTYRWLGDGWFQLDTERPRYVSFPERVETWGDSVIALRSFAPRYRKTYDELGPPASEQRATRTAIAKAKPLAVYAGPAKAPRLPETIDDFDTLPGGALMGIVSGFPSPPRVLTYDPSTQTSTTVPLPDAASVEIGGIELADDDRGYVFGGILDDEFEKTNPYLARYDGKTWHKEPGPPCGAGLIGVAWSKTAGLYAICRDDVIYPAGNLWRLTSGGWIEIELSLPGSVNGVVADHDGGVWISSTQAAYGPTRPRKILEVGGFDEIVTRMVEYGDPSPTRLRCSPGLEMHYTFLRGDVEGDHSEEKKLLAQVLAGDDSRGNIEVVTVEFRGEPRLALLVSLSIEASAIRKVEKAFAGRLLDTYCYTREPL